MNLCAERSLSSFASWLSFSFRHWDLLECPLYPRFHWTRQLPRWPWTWTASRYLGHWLWYSDWQHLHPSQVPSHQCPAKVASPQKWCSLSFPSTHHLLAPQCHHHFPHHHHCSRIWHHLPVWVSIMPNTVSCLPIPVTSLIIRVFRLHQIYALILTSSCVALSTAFARVCDNITIASSESELIIIGDGAHEAWAEELVNDGLDALFRARPARAWAAAWSICSLEHFLFIAVGISFNHRMYCRPHAIYFFTKSTPRLRQIHMKVIKKFPSRNLATAHHKRWLSAWHHIIHGVHVSELRSNECALIYAQSYVVCKDHALVKMSPIDDRWVLCFLGPGIRIW